MSSKRLHSILIFIGLCASPAFAEVEPHGGMLRHPDISRDQVVFSYANDLWTVSRDGGLARPLASPAGSEQRPRFSPDGKEIAFTGNYDGNNDLYIIPSEGGTARRITHHPGRETFCDWSGDDQLLFSAANYQGLGMAPKLFLVETSGGLPEELPVPYGAVASISPDGLLLAYTPHSRDRRTWKRYRGGMASDIWFLDLNSLESLRVTDWEGTDSQPMWHGGILYYVSDAGPNHRLNIWSYDPATDARRQVTSFADYDVKSPAIGPGPGGDGEIIFQYGTGLHVLDLATESTRKLEVSIPGDRPSIRQRRVRTASNISNYGISPSGARAVVESRGDIWTLPAENGIARNLTRTDGIAERDPAWSPDGQWIAYFSHATDEYELYITQSDGKGETRQLTFEGTPFKYAPSWSPDSKMILYFGKDSSMNLLDVAEGTSRVVDKDPFANIPNPVWSPDSRWITYDRTDEENLMGSIWIYDVQEDARHRITSPMFDDRNPTFDREGDYLYFTSGRTFRPQYSPVDGTFIYTAPGNLYAIPLREDVDRLWTVEIDEEEWDDGKEDEEEEGEEGEGEEGDEEGDGSDDEKEGDDEAEEGNEEEDSSLRRFQEDGAASDPISGTWNGALEIEGAGADVPTITFTMRLEMESDLSVSGTVEIDMVGTRDLSGNWDPGSSELTLASEDADEPTIFKIEGNTMTGIREEEGMRMIMTATREGADDGGSGSKEKSSKKKDEDEAEDLEIDFEGIESRTIKLPVGTGMFGQLAVNNQDKLLYVKDGDLMLYDISDADDKGTSVAAGVSSFDLAPDGSKLAHRRGGSVAIRKAGSGSSENAQTKGMVVMIEPREEWEQIYHDVWRIYRDFFYVENMHGVDWEAVRDQYAAMLPDVVTRADLNYVIGEMIAELNVGHAYRGGGDLEGGGESVNVGVLAADFELDQGAYRIMTIHEGGPWDADARGPLSQPGIDVEEGDWILAVNGEEIDTALDPHHAFIGTAGQVTVLTVNSKPTIDDDARELVIKPLRSDGRIRYRAWIERNRRYVDERTDGQVGYIHVPDTGVNGQNELYRQFYGQSGKKALIIDERWNGGGQIPWRFIELLNRPPTNYFALRDGMDWKTPQASHSGPKCMLVNGQAGSGGDMFPWLFRKAGLGKIIGTRTWGGLVGISGNPGPIDGGFIAVPRFGFYELDGTWGVEGHGVDPDIEVIDDPALMADGADPQLDRGIEQMLLELETNTFIPPTRPADPDRSGMGLPLEEQ